MANAYGHILIGTVPYERLGDSYTQAMRDHSSNFSLSTTDLLKAWEKIQSKESGGKLSDTKCLFCDNHREFPEVRPCPFHG